MSTNVNACYYCATTPGMLHKMACPLSGVVSGIQPAAPAMPSPPSASAERETVYVPIAVHQSDFARGSHPNDTTKADPDCQRELDNRGDDSGQGLDPYWKWGFRAGFAAARSGSPTSAPSGPQDERVMFEKAMNDARFFPSEINFMQVKSPSGRDEYANPHLESCWNGWKARAALAAKAPQ